MASMAKLVVLWTRDERNKFGLLTSSVKTVSFNTEPPPCVNTRESYRRCRSTISCRSELECVTEELMPLPPIRVNDPGGDMLDKLCRVLGSDAFTVIFDEIQLGTAALFCASTPEYAFIFLSARA